VATRDGDAAAQRAANEEASKLQAVVVMRMWAVLAAVSRRVFDANFGPDASELLEGWKEAVDQGAGHVTQLAVKTLYLTELYGVLQSAAESSRRDLCIVGLEARLQASQVRLRVGGEGLGSGRGRFGLRMLKATRGGAT